MNRIQKIKILLVTMLITCGLVGCGEKKDELVLVTTEATATSDATPVDAMAQEITSTEEEIVTEEALEKEKNITIQDLYEANKGDFILSGGMSFGLNTIYYSGDTEIFSDYTFLGFDEQGMYAQVYEDSEGKVQLLDTTNNYWYVVKDNEIKVLLYPEYYVAAAIIESNHNAMIYGLAKEDMNSNIIQDIYRMDGRVVVETMYGDGTGKNYIIKYVLESDFRVSEYTCYDLEGNKVSYSWITSGDTYSNPEPISEAKAMTEGYRTITVKYVDGEEIDMPYYLPLKYPVELSLVEYDAYADPACTVEWTEQEPDSDGVYKDVTIYMKKNTKEGE